MRTTHKRPIMTKYPVPEPLQEKETRERTILPIPSPDKICGPTLIDTAPIIPPIKEWDELLGIR